MDDKRWKKGASAPFFVRKRWKKGGLLMVNWDTWNSGNMHLHADDADASFRMPDMQKQDRTRQAKWDRRHIRTVSTKLRKNEYNELLDICALWNVKPYTLLRRLLRVHVLGRDDPPAPPLE